MKRITQRDLIRSVASHWREQYRRAIEAPRDSHDERKVMVALDLDALNPETATPNEINAIIGNASWTALDCDECKASVDTVIEVGAVPDYESSTARLCVACVAKAAALAQ